MVLDNVEPAVAQAFDSALSRLRKQGARITDIPLRELDELRGINAKGGIVTAEAYAVHRPLIAKAEKTYDPQVLVRILRGREQDAADYIDVLKARADFTRRVRAITAPYDALVMPTVPVVPPRIADVEPDEAYRRINMLVLRNPSIANFIDGCSISIPCHRAGRCAGRPDAVWRAWNRPPPAFDRRGDREGCVAESTARMVGSMTAGLCCL